MCKIETLTRAVAIMLRHAAKEAARLAAVRAVQQYSASTSGFSIRERLAPAAMAHQQSWSRGTVATCDFKVLQRSSQGICILHLCAADTLVLLQYL